MTNNTYMYTTDGITYYILKSTQQQSSIICMHLQPSVNMLMRNKDMFWYCYSFQGQMLSVYKMIKGRNR